MPGIQRGQHELGNVTMHDKLADGNICLLLPQCPHLWPRPAGADTPLSKGPIQLPSSKNQRVAWEIRFCAHTSMATHTASRCKLAETSPLLLCGTENTAQLVQRHLKVPFGAVQELSLFITDMLIKLSSLIATHCHHSAKVTSPGRERSVSPGLHPTAGDIVSTLLYPQDSTTDVFEQAENPPAAPKFMVLLFLFQIQMPICLQPFLKLCLSSLHLFPSEPAPTLWV